MDTQKTYAEFGAAVARLRLSTGMPLQGDLARAMGTTQQTVSRWESGVSRPRSAQLADLARVLSTDVGTLAELARYTSTSPVAITSFDQPFPVDQLAPESFERLTAHLVQELYADAEVSHFGSRGHDQAGLDIIARFADGRVFSFQCKRVVEFGPSKVHTVVAEHTEAADRKFLVLTRVASPDARRAMALHPGWELWDREDISRRIRTLSPDAQRRIVRIYFAGLEQALLGESIDGPWQTLEEFFEAFSRADILFNHEWDIVGRDGTLADLGTALDKPNVRAVFLTGAGGSGKSRLLKRTVEDLQVRNRGLAVRFLSRVGELTKRSLIELGSGSHLLVVDDAHDRDDLQVLFEFAATHPTTKLLFAARSYGIDRIRGQASGFSLAGSSVVEVALTPLQLDDAEALASQVLSRKGGPLGAAKSIARFTRDCPLATVMGAQVVATEGVEPRFLQNEDAFRTTLLGRFTDVVAGQLGEAGDEPSIRLVLPFLAVVQPFHIDDRRILEACEQTTGVLAHEVSRLLAVLVRAGVLFKRGSRYRLSPDLLGDYLIERACVGPGGRSTGYGERVFETVEGFAENILLNLGRMDWRRSDFGTDESPLLDGIWSQLRPSNPYSDPHVAAVKAVAYYQPKRALAFVRHHLANTDYRDALAEIAKYAAYTESHLPIALELLWKLGRDDTRSENGSSSHALRVMKELGQPQPNKPLSFTEQYVSFVLEVAAQPDTWGHHTAPLDLLEAALSTEGHHTSSERHTISFAPYFIRPDDVRDVRQRVVDAALEALGDPRVKKALAGAKLLNLALRFPHGLFNATVGDALREQWASQFAETMDLLLGRLASHRIDPLVQLEINQGMLWLATWGPVALKTKARAILDTAVNDLDYRTERALVDGHGMEDRRSHRDGHEARWARYLAEVTQDLLVAHPRGENLRAYLGLRIERIAELGQGRAASPHVLFRLLSQGSSELNLAMLSNALEHAESATVPYARFSLAEVIRHDRTEGLVWVAKYLASGREELRQAVAAAYADQSYEDGGLHVEDEETVLTLLGDNSEWVVRTALGVIRRLAERDPAGAIRLIRGIAFRSSVVADEAASLIEFDGGGPSFEMLSREDVLSFLDRLNGLAEMDGYWIDKLLANISKTFPRELAHLFMRRVEAAADDPESRLRPSNFGPYGPQGKEDRLAFRTTSDSDALMSEVIEWMKANRHRQGLFNWYAQQTFEAMFAPYDADFVRYLSGWLDRATEADLHVMSLILQQADGDFVFREADFVSALLTRAGQFGAGLHRSLTGALYSAAVSGMRSGVAGEPFPEDIALRDQAKSLMERTSQFSPVHELYEAIHSHALEAIRRVQVDEEDDE